MEKRRILLIVPRMNIGGAETYVKTVAIGLHDLGWEVHVASGGGSLVDDLKRAGVQHHFVPIRLHAGLAAYFLERIVRRYRINIMHANSAAAGIAAVKVKEKFGLPLIYTAHGIFGNRKEQCLRQCDKIICVSEAARKIQIERGFPEKKLCVMYTGIDLDAFKPDVKACQAIRHELGIEEDTFTVALVARIKNLRNKGHHDLLQIFREYPETKNWKALIVGTGKAYWKLRYLVWKEGLGDRILCLGQRNDVAAVMNAADVIVLPSRFETFGLVLVEAMAMGKPTVAYDVGGVREIGIEGRTGFCVESGNKREFYKKLGIISKNKCKFKKMGILWKDWVRTHYSFKIMLQGLISVYKEFIIEESSVF